MKNKLVIIFFLLSKIAISQNITIASFSIDSIKNQNNEVLDQNGEICAIIHVVTNENGFSWDSDALGIVSVEKDETGYYIFVPHGAKRISIAHNIYGVIRDYIYPLKILKGHAYELVLKTNISSESGSQVGTIEFESSPSMASFYLNDKKIGYCPSKIDTLFGEYRYRIELPFYSPDTGVVNISYKYPKQKISSILKPSFGSLHISSFPQNDAEVFIDGRMTGLKTPCMVDNIKCGIHQINIKYDRFHSDTLKIPIFDESSVNVSLGLTNYTPMRSRAFMRSIVFPGWGTSYLTGKKIHLLKGAFFYGTFFYFNNYFGGQRSHSDSNLDSSIEDFDKLNNQATIFTISLLSFWSLELIKVIFTEPVNRQNRIASSSLIPKQDFYSYNKNVYASKYKSHSSAFYKTIVFPGWGSQYLSDNYANLLKGIAAYGLVAHSYYSYQKSNEYYDKYKLEYDISKQDIFLNNAKRYSKYSKIEFGAAAAIWATEFIQIIFYKKDKAKLSYTPAIDPINHSVNLKLNINF